MRWALLVRRNLLRRPGRSALTVLGIASATLRSLKKHMISLADRFNRRRASRRAR